MRPVVRSTARYGGRHAGHYQRFGCANGSTRHERFGIRTEGEKLLAALKLGTAKPLPAVSRTVTAFETLVNADGTVVCRAK
jgi:hypothetical protein